MRSLQQIGEGWCVGWSDACFHHRFAIMAEDDQMFHVIAFDQHQTALGIQGGDFDQTYAFVLPPPNLRLG